MNSLLAAIADFFLLGSGRAGLHPGDAGVEFGFARPLPAWGWLLVLIGAGVLAGWSYRRLAGGRPARAALAVLRASVLAAIVLVISGPQLVRPNDRVERDWVLVLVDRSASMTIPDAPAGQSRTTREEQLRAALDASGPMWSGLSRAHDVVWMGFDRGAFDLRASPDGAPDLGRPEGRGTSLGAALDQALRRAAARPVSGVVILSDGRSTDEPDHAAIRRLQADHIPVVTVPLGSPEPVTDLAIDSAEAPSMAFIRDTVPVQVRIERLGAGEGAAPAEPARAEVELVDRATGIVLDRQPAVFSGDEARVSLKAHPDQAGQASWLVRLIPAGPDLIPANNQASLSVELVDRPLRVVYFDGYPRWEYRYIKNLLVREKSISSSSLLLAANRRSVQEGDVTLDAIPRSQEEWARFDVVILGDVRPEMFSREQMEQLREHVASRGGGLLWIGGPGATPVAWSQSPLADLLPFRIADPQSGGVLVKAWSEPVTMARTELAARLGLLELADTGAPDAGADPGWPSRLSDPATGWSNLRWAQRIDAGAIKPTAEVLATLTPASAPGGSAGGSPAVLSMRYGAGRVLYVATDETWRWRYARGEALQERFWLPLIRMQGRESLARSAKPATLEAAPRRALVEQPVRIALRLLDQSLVDQRLPAITVRVEPARQDPAGREAAEGPAPVQLRLALEDEGTGRAITQTYSTTWLPAEPGRYTATVSEPTLASLRLTAPIEVSYPDDELRRPRTDHALLARLSQETTGKVLEPDALSSLPGLLPKRDLRIAGAPDVETLWDRPMVLAVLLGLLTVEWVGRKLIQLS
jgi:hypothetical protein